MAKTLIFERSANVDAEQVEMKLFKMSRGYLLERRIVEKDASASVQVLLIKSLADFDRFANADPYSSHTTLFYNEVRRRLTDGE
ncbi:hypothetical protein [Caballeronia sordidicola]|uniref:Uncharacterized protein n=1 Tax=Caballeronia sordidicola TaxID=196367 RepID=A0A226WKK6_CABSO|nr:hypothetical protein [Caballeronia sordidicola]OXC71734.1 hypothetical protein BSU04_45625 [Caballeronia sordidicola]